jgi:hypothetical protein
MEHGYFQVHNNNCYYKKVIIMVKFIKTVLSILFITCLGSSQAYADLIGDDISSKGWPRFEGTVDVKWQKANSVKWKLEAKLQNGDYLDFQMYSGDDLLSVSNPTYQLKSTFTFNDQGIAVFDGGDLKITGRLSPYTDGVKGNKSAVLLTATLSGFAWDDDTIAFNTTNLDCPYFDDLCTNSESVWIELDAGGFSPIPKRFDDTGFAVTTIPVPAAVWLFGSGILGLASVARRKRKTT